MSFEFWGKGRKHAPCHSSNTDQGRARRGNRKKSVYDVRGAEEVDLKYLLRIRGTRSRSRGMNDGVDLVKFGDSLGHINDGGVRGNVHLMTSCDVAFVLEGCKCSFENGGREVG